MCPAAVARSGRGRPCTTAPGVERPPAAPPGAAPAGATSVETRATPQQASTTRRTPAGTTRRRPRTPRAASVQTMAVTSQSQAAHPSSTSSQTHTSTWSNGTGPARVDRDGHGQVGQQPAGQGEQCCGDHQPDREAAVERSGAGIPSHGPMLSFACVCISKRLFTLTSNRLSTDPSVPCGRVVAWPGRTSSSRCSTTSSSRPRRSTTPSATPTWRTGAARSTPR